MRFSHYFFSTLIVLSLAASCSPLDYSSEESPQEVSADVHPQILVEHAESGDLPDYELISQDDFEYLGFFQLPGPSGGSDWDYSGHGLTYYPSGDPGGEGDGFPGSLFGFGHDHQLFVSEISIPEPILASSLDQAYTAVTLQPFEDLTAGIFSAEEMTIPRAGLEYLEVPEPRLHFAFGQHFQDFEPSHGWGGLQIGNSSSSGPWIFDGYTNYVTNDYLFEIPTEWAAALGSSPFLASGRAREGLWSGRGPALFAYQPSEDPLPSGSVLESVYPLLLYGEQASGLPDIVSSSNQEVIDYREADHWWGGAWLTRGDAAGVIFAGTKAIGEEWYGFANGVEWEHDCAESNPPTCPDVPDWPYDNRGFWAEDFQAQLIFYDPGQLLAVARGEIDSWIPQPYEVMVLDDYLLDPDLNLEEYKRDLVGAVAYDRNHGFFYLVERLADEYRSVIHVWKIHP